MSPKRRRSKKSGTGEPCDEEAARLLREAEFYWTEERRAAAQPLPIEREPDGEEPETPDGP